MLFRSFTECRQLQRQPVGKAAANCRTGLSSGDSQRPSLAPLPKAPPLAFLSAPLAAAANADDRGGQSAVLQVVLVDAATRCRAQPRGPAVGAVVSDTAAAAATKIAAARASDVRSTVNATVSGGHSRYLLLGALSTAPSVARVRRCRRHRRRSGILHCEHGLVRAAARPTEGDRCQARSVWASSRLGVRSGLRQRPAPVRRAPGKGSCVVAVSRRAFVGRARSRDTSVLHNTLLF